MKQKIKYLIFLVLSVSLFTACNKNTPDTYAQFEGKDPQKLFIEGEQQMIDGHYTDAIKTFDAIEALYPFSASAEQAKLETIYANYKRDDMPATITSAKQYLHIYPTSKHADYALYMKGLAQFETSHGILSQFLPINVNERDLTNERHAFDDFNELLARYPNSPYAPDVRSRMIYLRNILARQEIAVADYYMRREAYVAAANRANYVINHFDQSPEVVDALVILVRAYHKLGMPELSKQSMDVLVANYPELPQTQALLKKKKK